jgi:amidophosphoribosyltransferase
MCGIVGMVAKREVTQEIFDALTLLQHRGQDAAGILVSSATRMNLRKGNGLVRDVFQQETIQSLSGHLGIGHVRYPTAGSDNPDESQPFYVNSPYGLGLVHNGNLINAKYLSSALAEADLRRLNTASDSEVLLNIVAHAFQEVRASCLDKQVLEQVFSRVFARLQGAFSVLMLVQGQGLIAFRDALGIRPLCFGVRDSGQGPEYMVASESVALDALGFRFIDDVKAGEVIFFPEATNYDPSNSPPNSRDYLRIQLADRHEPIRPCIFEYIYLARPDSVLDGISVYQARLGLGKALAQAIRTQWLSSASSLPIDVVIPVPDTSRVSALALANDLGLPFCEGLIKNRYIGRTFIMPGQTQRKNSVRLKLNAIKEEIRGRHVLLVDDSIVRGTTSREIIQMVREAGARSVSFASAAPPVCYPNLYGIDIPSSAELIAHGRSVNEIAKWIGADRLIYQTLPAAVEAINQGALYPEAKVARFEDAIFSGDYPLGQVNERFLADWAVSREEDRVLSF